MILGKDVIQHKTRGNEFYQAGKCVTCGKKKQDAKVYHCDACYDKIMMATLDSDDE